MPLWFQNHDFWPMTIAYFTSAISCNYIISYFTVRYKGLSVTKGLFKNCMERFVVAFINQLEKSTSLFQPSCLSVLLSEFRLFCVTFVTKNNFPNLNYYFHLHICPSMRSSVRPFVTLQRYITLIAPEAPTALVPGAPEPRIYPRSG